MCVCGCVISFFYIKPQLCIYLIFLQGVVLYLSSTSNHNLALRPKIQKRVVLYLSSTSNHNFQQSSLCYKMLCYIFLLHQTTTRAWKKDYFTRLCYIFLLHQTTTFLGECFRLVLLCYIFLLHQTTTDNQHRLFRF